MNICRFYLLAGQEKIPVLLQRKKKHKQTLIQKTRSYYVSRIKCKQTHKSEINYENLIFPKINTTTILLPLPDKRSLAITTALPNAAVVCDNNVINLLYDKFNDTKNPQIFM